jgi:CBS domain-containing protein
VDFDPSQTGGLPFVRESHIEPEEPIMKARDVMTTHAISVGPDLPVQAVANTLVKNGISAVPVVGNDGKLLGIVSEGDLLRRVETGTERRRSWWLDMISSGRSMAAEFAKTHGLKAEDVMTTFVVTADPDTPLNEIAELMERHGVKRIPIVEGGQVVGIVSRANLVQALASGMQDEPVENTDEALREAVIAQLTGQPWGRGMINVIVHDGAVDLWGVVDNADEKKAVRIVAERIPGVRSVNDNLRIYQVSSGI